MVVFYYKLKADPLQMSEVFFLFLVTLFYEYWLPWSPLLLSSLSSGSLPSSLFSLPVPGPLPKAICWGKT